MLINARGVEILEVSFKVVELLTTELDVLEELEVVVDVVEVVVVEISVLVEIVSGSTEEQLVLVNKLLDTSRGMMKTIKEEKYQATRTARVTNTGCRIQFEYLNITRSILNFLIVQNFSPTSIIL